jgi:hypothetical protein
MYGTKPKNKTEAIQRINSTLKDCKGHKKWDLYDEGNWEAMIKNLEEVKQWLKEDVSFKGVWEVKKNAKS